MQGLGRGGGGGGHRGGGGGGGGGGFHRGGGGGFRHRGPRSIFSGGVPAYFAPGYGYPYYYDDGYPLQVVVPESCEESVRSGCYQRWSQDATRMAQCVRDGYRGCGLKGLGDAGGCATGTAMVAGAMLGAAAGGFAAKSPWGALVGGILGAVIPSFAC